MGEQLPSKRIRSVHKLLQQNGVHQSHVFLHGDNDFSYVTYMQGKSYEYCVTDFTDASG